MEGCDTRALLPINTSMLKELIIFVASVCGSPDVVSCEVYQFKGQEDPRFVLHVYTTNVVMERNDFMTTGGRRIRIDTRFFKAEP